MGISLQEFYGRREAAAAVQPAAPIEAAPIPTPTQVPAAPTVTPPPSEPVAPRAPGSISVEEFYGRKPGLAPWQQGALVHEARRAEGAAAAGAPIPGMPAAAPAAPAPARGYVPIPPMELPPPGAGRVAGSLARAAGRALGDVPLAIPEQIEVQREAVQPKIEDVWARIDAGEVFRPWDLPGMGVPPGMQHEITRYQRATPEQRKAMRAAVPTLEERPGFALAEKGRTALEKALPPDPRAEAAYPFTHALAQGLGSWGGFAIAGGAGAALGMPALPVMALTGAAANASGSFRDAIESGASFEDALQASRLSGIVGTTEALPIARVFDRFDKATGGSLKRAVIEGLKGGAEEGIQEVVQSVADGLIASKIVAYDPERGVFEGTAEGGAVGFTVGALASFVAGMLGARIRGPGEMEERAPPPTPPEPVTEPGEPPGRPALGTRPALERFRQAAMAGTAIAPEVAERQIAALEAFRTGARPPAVGAPPAPPEATAQFEEPVRAAVEMPPPRPVGRQQALVAPRPREEEPPEEPAAAEGALEAPAPDELVRPPMGFDEALAGLAHVVRDRDIGPSPPRRQNAYVIDRTGRIWQANDPAGGHAEIFYNIAQEMGEEEDFKIESDQGLVLITEFGGELGIEAWGDEDPSPRQRAAIDGMVAKMRREVPGSVASYERRGRDGRRREGEWTPVALRARPSGRTDLDEAPTEAQPTPEGSRVPVEGVPGEPAPTITHARSEETARGDEQERLPEEPAAGTREEAAAVEAGETEAEAPAGLAAPEGVLRIEDYSDQALIIRGETRENKERIKAAGLTARWNPRAKGWVFPRRLEGKAREGLADLLAPAPAPVAEPEAPAAPAQVPPVPAGPEEGARPAAQPTNRAEFVERMSTVGGADVGDAHYSTRTYDDNWVVERRTRRGGKTWLTTIGPVPPAPPWDKEQAIARAVEDAFPGEETAEAPVPEQPMPAATERPPGAGEQAGPATPEAPGGAAVVPIVQIADWESFTPDQISDEQWRQLVEEAAAIRGDAGMGELDMNLLARLMGLERYEPNTRAGKVVEEVAEAGLAKRYRDIFGMSPTQSEEGWRSSIRELIAAYEQQPRLGTRTATSAANQAYSTPAPIGLMLARKLNVETTDSILEPTAGTGLLLVGVERGTFVDTNEIDPLRIKLLQAQGYTPTTLDATTRELPAGPYDVVLANPPFGTRQTETGRREPLAVFDPVTGEPVWRGQALDQAIALNAAMRLEPGGRLGLVMAGPSPKVLDDPDARRSSYNAKAQFFSTLSQLFDVEHHVTVPGRLYVGQGAAWPIDVIVATRRPERLSREEVVATLPSMEAPTLVGSWQELEDALVRADRGRPRVLGRAGEQPAAAPEPEPEAVRPDREAERPEQRPSEGGRARPVGERGPVRPAGEPGAAPGGVGGRPEVRGGGVRAGAGEPVPGGAAGGGRGAGGVPARDVAEGAPRGRPRVAPPAAEQLPVPVEPTELQVPYRTRSKRASLDTLTPTALAAPTRQALAALEARVGDLDAFVQRELGYESMEETILGAEQVDAVALAIDNAKRGRGFVIGDQTGVGKGVVVASMIRWARRNGMMPVFMTEKPSLYLDMMFRDLPDVGERDLKAFPTNASFDGKKSLTHEETGQTIRIPKTQKAILEAGGQGNFAPLDAFDVVLTTYDQANTTKGKKAPRHHFMDALAPKAFMILDESHNAGGTGITWEDVEIAARAGKPMLPRELLIRDWLTRAKAAMFSSATWAKRPQTMTLYATRTDIGLAVPGQDVGDIFARGGVPMQQAVAAMLARNGQYIRREKSFEGIEFQEQVLELDTKAVDRFSETLSDIIQWDAEYGQEIRGRHRAAVGAERGHDAAEAVDATEFTSIMATVLDQVFTAFKVNAVADETIKALRNGEKPVVVFDNTMGAILSEMVEAGLVQPGESMEFGIEHLVRRYLDRRLGYTYTDPVTKQRERIWISQEFLTPDERETFEEQARKIEERLGGSDVPGSPIDALAQRIEAAGYRVGEITGRNLRVNYATGRMEARKDAGSPEVRARTVSEFNDGRLDALVINRSGATGISMHASERVKDQSPRVMILAQFEKNIDTFLQVLGRINRTGQVTLPRYVIPSSNIPAENRLLAVLKRKLVSLQANLSASGRGQVEIEKVPDFMNEVGDAAAFTVLADDHSMRRRMRLGLPDDVPTGFVTRATGRVALLPVARQTEFYDHLFDEYQVEWVRRRAEGRTLGAAEVQDLKAIPEKRSIYRVADGPSAFQGAVTAVQIDAALLTRPPTWAGTESELDRNYGEERRSAVTPLVEDARHALAVEREEIGKDREQLSERLTKAQARLAKALDENARKNAEKRVTSLANQLDELGKHETSIDKTAADTISGLQAFGPGTAFSVRRGEQTIFGRIVKVERNKRVKKAYSPSAWNLTMAMASTRPPRAKMNIRSFMKDEPAIVSARTAEAEFDRVEEKTARGRETRVMLAGNIPRAMALAPETAEIVQLTDASGRIGEGVLMPPWIEELGTAEARSLSFRTVETAMRFLGEDGARLGVRATPADASEMFIERAGETLDIMAPASGKRYATNKAVRAAIAPREMVRDYRRRYEVTIPIGKGPALLQAILAMKAVLHPLNQEERARQIQGVGGGLGVMDMQPARGLFEQLDEIEAGVDREAAAARDEAPEITAARAWLRHAIAAPGFDARLGALQEKGPDSDRWLSWHLHQIGIDWRGKQAGDIRAEVSELYAGLPLHKIWDWWLAPAFDRWWEPLGTVPGRHEYLGPRYRALGAGWEGGQLTKRMYERLRKLDDVSLEEVYRYLTTRGAKPSMIADPEARAAGVEAKRIIDLIGRQLVKEGMLEPQQYAKYRDQYLPRMYLKYLLEGTGASMGAGNRPQVSRQTMDRLKRRKDIPKWVRQIVLGEVKDPAFLVAKAMGAAIRDIAILEFIKKIARNGNWTYPGGLVKWGSRWVTPRWLMAEAGRLREQVEFYPQADRKTVRALAEVMEIEARKVLANPPDPKLYRELPDTKRYGVMRGLWVRKEIFQDLVGDPMILGPEAGVWHDIEAALMEMTRFFKWSKTAASPTTQARNFIGNAVLVHLSGVPLARILSLELPLRTLHSIRTNGRAYQVAKRYGVRAVTFSAQELQRIEQDFRAHLGREHDIPFGRRQLDRFATFYNAVSDVYGLSEAFWKTLKIEHELAKGASEEEAALAAHKWVFDYSFVPQLVRHLRNYPLGIPFITFMYKALPRALEAAFKNPLAFTPYIVMPMIAAVLTSIVFDVDEDDLAILDELVLDFIRERGHAMVLPAKDEHGRWQMLDYGYLMPWVGWWEILQNVRKGELGEVAGMFGGPVATIITGWGTNRDPFFDRDISHEGDPPVKRLYDKLSWAFNQMVPPWMGLGSGQIAALYRAIEGTPRRTGEPGRSLGQEIARWFGFNVYPIDPVEQRRTETFFKEREIRDAEARLSSIRRDKSLSRDARRDAMDDQREHIDQLKDELREWRKRTRVPPEMRVRSYRKEQDQEQQLAPQGAAGEQRSDRQDLPDRLAGLIRAGDEQELGTVIEEERPALEQLVAAAHQAGSPALAAIIREMPA